MMVTNHIVWRFFFTAGNKNQKFTTFRYLFTSIILTCKLCISFLFIKILSFLLCKYCMSTLHCIKITGSAAVSLSFSLWSSLSLSSSLSLFLSLSLSAFKGGRVPEAYNYNEYMKNVKKKKTELFNRFGNRSLLNVLSSLPPLSLSLSLSAF